MSLYCSFTQSCKKAISLITQVKEGIEKILHPFINLTKIQLVIISDFLEKVQS